MRQVLIGILALALVVGAFGVTGFVLVNGGLTRNFTPAFAEFSNCGQGLRVRGDVKLRGVLVGFIEDIDRELGQNCRVMLGLFPDKTEQIPANVGAQIRAKTIFGEKWVELLYPKDSATATIGEDDVIPTSRTIDPLEVETILNTALPLLESIDPENLAATLDALANGFSGHEEAAIRATVSGIRALEPLNENEGLLNKGISQLAESGKVFQDIDDDLFVALEKLDNVQRFTIDKQALIAANFQKVPALLDELQFLFSSRFSDITKLVDRGATVIGILAARTEDLDRLLTVLPEFNSRWIRNLGHTCRHRQPTDEKKANGETKEPGDRVPGRCWRVHNLLSHTQGPYNKRNKPRPHDDDGAAPAVATKADVQELGVSGAIDLGRLMLTPSLTEDGG